MITKMDDMQIGKIYRIKHYNVISYIVVLGFDETFSERRKRIKYMLINDPSQVDISLSEPLFFKTYSVELMK